ncbi:hypothetical protein SKAU_G00016540 [Synaphobranchus kaupii]|uniref:P/Homo B domain-containing protein n=1 Tax=Synaphobranchus kaupii TaxID=118154 RepID=A0A9Q1JBS4_SYNKA|nr:hypothetical protein SKAU_G00016540 [Synaphobranchus kaupii]
MWYIHCNDDIHNCQSDMNIVGAWKRGYTGKDVVVTILDDGIERNHPDLVQNYDTQASYDVNGNDLDPMPRYDASNENKHGTRCAGEVAASANNSHCTVGIAYNAKIGGVRMLDGDVTDMVEAKSLSLHPQHIDIYSASWGPDDDGKTVDGPASLARQAFESGIRQGRKGRGSIFVWASGNGGRSRDHCSCDGYTNSIYTISISSTAESGKKPWYLEECASTLSTTYSSGENYDRKIITTDLRQRCTDSHTGTSASAPMAAGIIALTLEANPLLTWRDVQHIIVKTSRAGHLNAPDWKTNAAGYNVSHLYGFGLMDAEAMVKEAERWKQVPTQHICVESADRQIRTIRPENVVRSVYKATGCIDNSNHHVIYLEHVVVRITITHPRRGDLSINLTSPSGTKSQLLANRLFDHSMEGFKNWEFMTTHCWGEKAAGDWILEIYDSPSQLRSQKVPGKLKEWSLVLYGTSVHPYSSSLRYEKPRSAEPPTDDEFQEEYSGPCDAECNENGCEGPGPHNCINCLHYFLKFKNNTRTCVPECPSGFFRDDKKRCKKCNSMCETCVGSRMDQCTSCKSGFHLNEGTNSCVSSCGEGHYLDHDGNVCRKYVETKECVRCHSDCAECDGPDEDDCDSCRDAAAVRYNGECLPKCPTNSYHDMDTMECRDCDRSCLTCSGPTPDSCLSCEEGMQRDIHGHCIFETTTRTSCSITPVWSSVRWGFYSDKEQRLCERCHFTCESCRGRHSVECLTCKSHLLKLGRGCVETCGSGHYANMSSRTCLRCDPTCNECTGGGSAHCLTCRDRYFYLKSHGRCYPSCPDNHYADTRSGTCERCHPTCRTCTGEGPLVCQSCYMGYTFLHGICESDCMIGEYATAVSPSLMCENCDGSCIDCKGPGPYNCTICPALELLSNDGRCLRCCSEDSRKDSAPMPHDCCNCTESREECILWVNFRIRGADELEELAGRPVLFIMTSIILLLSLGGVIFLFLHKRSKDGPKVKAGGSAHFREAQQVDYQDREEEEEDDDEEDEDIVYMGQDGTVYRKFKYGLLEEDEEEELEYDDESYSFR